MTIEPKKARMDVIKKALRKEMEERGLGVIDVAKDMDKTSAYISRYLNSDIITSDSFYKKVGKAIGLSNKEIKSIFLKGDIEEIRTEYGDDILQKELYSSDELLEIYADFEGLSDKEKAELKEMAEFKKYLKNKKNNE